MATTTTPIRGTRLIKIRVGDLFIERRLLPFLRARCEETDLDFPKFLCGLIDREQSECIRSGWKPSPPAPPIRPKGETVEKIEARSSRGKLSAEDEDRIVVARFSGMKPRPIAERFNTSESTVHRIWKRRAPSGETIQGILHLGTRTHGDEGEPTGGIQGIAKKYSVSENIVSAIIQNHRPLTPPSTIVGPKYVPDHVSRKGEASWKRGTKWGSDGTLTSMK
jgi:hypothetical protein